MNKKMCIGILGGGQLARMSAYEAYRLGFDVAILEKEKDSPAGQLTHNEFIGWVDNQDKLKNFSDRSDIITLENEFIDHTYLKIIESWGKVVIPFSSTIELIQDKLIQKETLRKKKIPVPDFIKIDADTLYTDTASVLGKKFVMKSRKMGYDGYGNHLVSNEKSFSNGIQKLSSRHSELMAEKFVAFSKELAVMVVRTQKEIRTYPVVETVQKNHICHTVIAPAAIPRKVYSLAEQIAIESVKAVGGFGIFGVELFYCENGDVLVNEMAPRPHNSGHYTIDACITSQFENHIRSVLGLPLGSTAMVNKFAVMINLLGKKEGAGVIGNYPEALKNDSMHLHVYGKHKSRPGRKMGHLTIVGNNLPELLKAANSAERKIII